MEGRVNKWDSEKAMLASTESDLLFIFNQGLDMFGHDLKRGRRFSKFIMSPWQVVFHSIRVFFFEG